MSERTGGRGTKATRYRHAAGQTRHATLPSEVPIRHRVRPTLSRRLRYAFDNAISRRPWMVLLWLGLATLGVALAATLVLSLGSIEGINGSEPETIPEAFWQTLLRIIDTGTIANDVGWPARIVALLVTITGIFLAGSLIGLITNLLDQKLVDLRKGTSLVLESDHTLILGWSPRVPTIVQELVIANQSHKHSSIVVVADEDKTAIEDTLRRAVPHTGTTRIVCRSGEPWTEESLAMGNLTSARSVIVTGAGGDAETVKTLLAIRTSPDDTPAGIVAELADTGLARSLETVIGPTLRTVCSDVIVAELTAQACRERGLAAVFGDLLDFEGSEFYVQPFPALVGRTYEEACLSFVSSSVVGLSDGTTVRLNPAPDTVIREGDHVVAVSDDDSAFVLGRLLPTGSEVPVLDGRSALRTRRLAIVGWSRLAARVVAEMDEFMGPGTQLDVVIDPAHIDPAIVHVTELANATLRVVELSGGAEDVAEHIHTGRYDQVILLGLRDHFTVDEADARTLLTVLALHTHPAQQRDRLRIVVELLDQRHAPLARATGADDFVVSDQLTSQMMSQISEDPELAPLFDELFSAAGSSLQLRPLLPAASGATFADVVRDGLRQGVTPIGFVDVDTGTVRLSPDKTVRLQPTAHERVVVVAPGT